MQALFIGKTDAETLGYDFGIFIAQQAKTYRTSQAAIVAALRPSITPSQPGTSHAPAADTPAPPPAGETTDDAKGLSSLALASSVEPIQPSPLPGEIETASRAATKARRDRLGMGK